MSLSHDATALLRAVLAENCADDLAARQHLVSAREFGVDPLDYCAHQFGLGNRLVWRRAAQWAGYLFADALPSHPALPRHGPLKLDHLGEIRSLRHSALGQDLTFVAPRFEQVLKLKASASADLSRRIRFAPPEAFEAAIARAASAQLMDHARQRTTQLWPRASAAIDLPLPMRVGFVAILVLLIVLVMLSGIIARPFLIPVVALLLMAPGLLRLFAALPGPPPPDPAPLADADLPIYSVLIPLRDESQMVPMLQRAMSAIDYPALCIKRTKHTPSRTRVLARYWGYERPASYQHPESQSRQPARLYRQAGARLGTGPFGPVAHHRHYAPVRGAKGWRELSDALRHSPAVQAA